MRALFSATIRDYLHEATAEILETESEESPDELLDEEYVPDSRAVDSEGDESGDDLLQDEAEPTRSAREDFVSGNYYGLDQRLELVWPHLAPYLRDTSSPVHKTARTLFRVSQFQDPDAAIAHETQEEIDEVFAELRHWGETGAADPD